MTQVLLPQAKHRQLLVYPGMVVGVYFWPFTLATVANEDRLSPGSGN